MVNSTSTERFEHSSAVLGSSRSPNTYKGASRLPSDSLIIKTFYSPDSSSDRMSTSSLYPNDPPHESRNPLSLHLQVSYNVYLIHDQVSSFPAFSSMLHISISNYFGGILNLYYLYFQALTYSSVQVRRMVSYLCNNVGI